MRESRPDLVTSMMFLAKTTENRLVLQVAGSTIIGTPILSKDELDENDFANIAINTFNQFRDSISSDDKDSDATPADTITPRQLVWLKDVSILGSSTINLPFLTIFVSEISAVSIGDIPKSE